MSPGLANPAGAPGARIRGPKSKSGRHQQPDKKKLKPRIVKHEAFKRKVAELEQRVCEFVSPFPFTELLSHVN